MPLSPGNRREQGNHVPFIERGIQTSNIMDVSPVFQDVDKVPESILSRKHQLTQSFVSPDELSEERADARTSRKIKLDLHIHNLAKRCKRLHRDLNTEYLRTSGPRSEKPQSVQSGEFTI